MNCFYCNAELTEQELEEYSKVPTCCSGRDCGCMGMPIEPPICDKCAIGKDDNNVDQKSM